MLRLNPKITRVPAPPVADAQEWIAGRRFPGNKPLLDIAQAVPGYAPAAELVDHLATRLGDPASARYTDITGLPALREELASHLAGYYGGDVGTRDVAITAGCNQGFCSAVMALAGPGDEVVLPLPFYFNHMMWLDMLGIDAVHIEFEPRSGGIPDPDCVRRAITPRTRAIALVTPNNPTGAVFAPGVLRQLYELARDSGVALILDETYKDFRTDDSPPHDLLADAHWRGTLVQLYSFSKAYALTGYRVGSVTCGPELMEQIAKIQDCVAICAPHVAQEAALFGLRHLGEWRRGKSELMRSRMSTLEREFERQDLAYRLVSSGAYFAYRLVSSGAYFAYVRHPFPGVASSEVARRLADRHNVLCLPGSMFGPGQEDYLRFAFANLDEAEIPKLIERLVDSQSH